MGKKTVVTVFDRKCKDCGNEFKTRGAGAFRCPSCSKKHTKECRRLAKKRYRTEARISAVQKTDDASAEESRCPYCGVVVFGTTYCRECEDAGWNEVHKMFGLTNGWDAKPKPPKVRAVAGTRGHVSGSFVCTSYYGNS